MIIASFKSGKRRRQNHEINLQQVIIYIFIHSSKFVFWAVKKRADRGRHMQIQTSSTAEKKTPMIIPRVVKARRRKINKLCFFFFRFFSFWDDDQRTVKLVNMLQSCEPTKEQDEEII
jgi:hypothetical protein